MASFNFLKGANSILQETHSSAIMVGRRRQDERKVFPNNCLFCLLLGWAELRLGPVWMWEPVVTWH